MKELNKVQVQEVNGGIFIGLFEGIFPMFWNTGKHLR
jgi:hypothetical protein